MSNANKNNSVRPSKQNRKEKTAANKLRRANKRNKNQSLVSLHGGEIGSDSAQSRRRYFTNKTDRLDSLNAERKASNQRPFSLSTMPRITPPEKKVKASPIVAVVASAPAIVNVPLPAAIIKANKVKVRAPLKAKVMPKTAPAKAKLVPAKAKKATKKAAPKAKPKAKK